MEINATLFGQMITFAIFVCFTMKVVWPVLESQLEERKKKISEGLAAAEMGHKTLERSEIDAKNQISQAREKCHNILEEAEKQAAWILEQAKEQAIKEKETILSSGYGQIDQAITQARQELKEELSSLVIHGVETILGRSITPTDHEKFLDGLAKKL